MKTADQNRVATLLDKWLGSEGNERANYQTFFGDLCVALNVEPPAPKGTVAGDPYCFDKDIKFYSDKRATTRFADFYKEGCFLIEAKQGSTSSSKGHGKRGTKAYRDAMQQAFNQARSYAYNRMLPTLPPFLITCDIGSHFEIWEGFSGEYGSYGARQRLNLKDLQQPEVFDRLLKIFTDPQALNPEKYRARVTREVAAELAKLSKGLEAQGYGAEVASGFLMRCIFTMFAEDVELLPGELFTKALRDRWIPQPETFKPEIEQLWRTMDTGGSFGFERVLRFNGSFFEEATAIPLPKDQLEVLYAAAAKDWSQVEPAIFGTLLERALAKKERSRLGAHYTPRSYVERLVRPVVMEPLRQAWDEVELEVKRLLAPAKGKTEPSKKNRQAAEQEIRGFLAQLRSLKILDPACGTGNFLYVALDLLKGLELEVQTRLVDVVGEVQLGLEQINPSQFLGIEINPRAAAIAELVIWIGYLQWFFKRYGNAEPPEPVLRAFGNIECRDAVLAYDGREPDLDPQTGVVRTRWGGKMMRHPVTGEEVPDPSDQVVIYKYLNPRAAEWPAADYVVSNPPFIGNKRMRETLGDGYTEALRNTYNEVPDSADYVMYWWYFSATLTKGEIIRRFGLITTNSINQSFNSRLVEKIRKGGISLTFAIPDHPWVDNSDGAAVRVAMTLADRGKGKPGKLLVLRGDIDILEDPKKLVFNKEMGIINANLDLGINAASLTRLRSNQGIVFQGVIPIGDGFKLRKEDLGRFGYSPSSHPEIIKPYVIGMDIVRTPKRKWIIDLFGLSESQVASEFPQVYQHIYETVRPIRLQNREPSRREKWWLFARSNEDLRAAINPLNNFIATPDTSKFKPFTVMDARTLPDAQVYCIASEDVYILGVLESLIHQSWLKKIAPRMGKGNDLRWKPSVVFDLFPFPDPTPDQKQKIRDLGDRLDAHRKQVQATHPDITITGMYNLLEKLRKGEAFTEKDRELNNRALVSTLKQIHDELDAAVLAAYGWPVEISDEQILERLVALNAERAEEERNGLIRWLRPEYQAPDAVQPVQTELAGIAPKTEPVVEPVEQQKWPTKPKDQLAAIRDLLRGSTGQWTVKQIAAQFKGRVTEKKLAAIADNLERLEWFGLVVSNPEADLTYWQFVTD